MSEIVASNADSCTNETEQVSEALQNVVIVDKASKLAALQGTDTDSSPPVDHGEVPNGSSDLGDKPELHHNGTSQNGDVAAEQAVATKSADAADPVVNSEPVKESTEETSMEATATGKDTEDKSPKESDEVKLETSSNNEPKSDAVSDEQINPSNVDVQSGSSDSTSPSKSATSTVPETEVSSPLESKKSPAKDATAEQTESDQAAVNKPVEDGSSKPSPGKKSCSPF